MSYIWKSKKLKREFRRRNYKVVDEFFWVASSNNIVTINKKFYDIQIKWSLFGRRPLEIRLDGKKLNVNRVFLIKQEAKNYINANLLSLMREEHRLKYLLRQRDRLYGR